MIADIWPLMLVVFVAIVMTFVSGWAMSGGEVKEVDDE